MGSGMAFALAWMEHRTGDSYTSPQENIFNIIPGIVPLRIALIKPMTIVPTAKTGVGEIAVNTTVYATRNGHEVLRSIVGLDPIDVMHYPITGNGMIQLLLHDSDMHEYLFAVLD